MKKFYYYIFYRYTDYYAGGESSPHIGGCVLVVMVILSYVLSILNATLYFTGGHLNSKMIYIVGAIVLVPNMFILTNKRYLALKEQYKDEKHKKEKGWGVFFLFLLSIAIFCLTLPLQK